MRHTRWCLLVLRQVSPLWLRFVVFNGLWAVAYPRVFDVLLPFAVFSAALRLRDSSAGFSQKQPEKPMDSAHYELVIVVARHN